MTAIRKHKRRFKGDPIRFNQIGCGYCKKQLFCEKWDSNTNKAKEGCKEYEHHEY